MISLNEKLRIDQIEFGKIDANNELQELGVDFYMQSFLSYDRYKVDSFINGQNYFICGNKGTGKTALLKYLECVFSKDSEILVIPVRFKTDFENEDKNQIRKVSNNVSGTVINEETIDKADSYVRAWEVYIIKTILEKSKIGEYNLFNNDKNYKAMCLLLDALYSEQKDRVIPKLSKGYAKINASTLKGIEASLETEIEFNRETAKINFQKTARAIENLFENLDYGSTPVRILIDELELSTRNQKEFNRDIELIRDLVLATDKLNHLFKEKGYNIQIIVSLRSEVINHVLTHGYEINKCVEDYGVNVEWYQKGGDLDDHPLLKLIEYKIHASERKNGINPTENVWKTYFSETINGTAVRKYILSYSWYRPRDIIRMMRLVQDQWAGEEIISQEMFDRAMQSYSEKMWNEIAEELVLSYPQKDDIKAIKKFFTGVEVPFTFTYLNYRAKDLSAIYPYLKEFFDKYKMIDFCEKMYEWGVIGNSGIRMSFSFLGDRELDPTADMILHRPLRNLFAVKSRR